MMIRRVGKGAGTPFSNRSRLLCAVPTVQASCADPPWWARRCAVQQVSPCTGPRLCPTASEMRRVAAAVVAPSPLAGEGMHSVSTERTG